MLFNNRTDHSSGEQRAWLKYGVNSILKYIKSSHYSHLLNKPANQKQFHYWAIGEGKKN